MTDSSPSASGAPAPAPRLGIGTIVAIITGALITLRWAIIKLPKPPVQLDPTQSQLLEELQYKVAELDEVKQRLAELEERQDFTERLLTKPQS